MFKLLPKHFQHRAASVALAAATCVVMTAQAADAPPLPPKLKLTDDNVTVVQTMTSGSFVKQSKLPGQIVLSEDFDDGKLGALNTHAYFDHSLHVVGKYSGDAPGSSITGNKIVRFELRPEDRKPGARWRTELTSGFKNVLDARKTNWAEWYLYFPKNFNPGKIDGNMIIAQIHGNGSPDGAPVATLSIQNDNNGKPYYWGAMGKTLRAGKPYVKSITKGGTRAQKFSEYGEWVKLTIQFKASLKGDGVLKMWKNDVLIAQMTGNVGTSVSVDPYFKTGLYHKGSNDTVIFADNIRLSVQ